MSGVKPGQILSSPGFLEETRAYLQRRLTLLTGSVTGIILVLAIGFVISKLLGGTPVITVIREFTLEFPNAILFAMVVASGSLHLLLRFRAHSERFLSILDGVFLQILVVPSLILYGELHHFAFSGFGVIVAFQTLFILARAVLIPSTATRTVLFSLLAPVAVFVIQLSYGDSFAFPEVPYPRSHFVDMLIQNQVILIGAISVAAIASRVNLSLRRRSYDARHLGQYSIRHRIGQGAMGDVYLAEHQTLKRPTAIKLLRPELAGEGQLRRFLQEVKLTSRLNHPNTVSVFDYGHTADGAFYYVMELLSGANLRQVVERSGPLPASRVIHVLSQACSALSEAHRVGLVHRDIKPANIMLCDLGGIPDVVKILDFGLATDRRGERDLEYALAGTPETMAPEMAAGEAPEPTADLYSLAAVGYYLLTGTPIFEAPSLRELAQLHRDVEPEPPSSRVDTVPRDLEACLLRGLSKDPQERFPSAEAMKEALLQCLDAGAWSEREATEWWRTFSPDPAVDSPPTPIDETVVVAPPTDTPFPAPPR